MRLSERGLRIIGYYTFLVGDSMPVLVLIVCMILMDFRWLMTGSDKNTSPFITCSSVTLFYPASCLQSTLLSIIIKSALRDQTLSYKKFIFSENN